MCSWNTLGQAGLHPTDIFQLPGNCGGDPLYQGTSGAQEEIRNRIAKCGGQTRQEFAFSICGEPAGLGTPRQAVSGNWGHRETLPGFFLPIPQAEDPMTWAAPTHGTGDLWQWLLDGWVGLGFDLWSKPVFPRWSDTTAGITATGKESGNH